MTQRSRPTQRATDLADAIHSAAIHVLRYLRTEDQALGLSGPRLSALSVLVFRGPLTVGQLARAEQVTPATISRLVTDLEEQGLAERSPDEADARVRRISATSRGTALLHEARRRRVERLALELEQLGAADRETLRQAASLLERIVSGGARRPRRRTPLRGGAAPVAPPRG